MEDKVPTTRPSPPPPPQKKAKAMTVAGVTFTADQVVSAVVKIDGREVYIQKREDDKRIGFQAHE